MAKVIYSRTKNLASLIARRAIMAGSWSHEALIFSERFVVESTFGNGVHYTPIEEFMKRASKTAIREFEVKDQAAADKWLLEQIGKGYDYKGALGLGFGKDWNDPDRHWCSEIVEGYFRAGGSPRFLHNLGKLNPTISYMVA